jgi:threonine/homoserine/homoserine lactone efflux protein
MNQELLLSLLEGLVIGILIAVPVGPIALLCINRTLAHGRLSGFVSGLGAATADVLYAGLAAFGVTLILNFLSQHHWYIIFGGGIILCVLGIKIFITKLNGQDMVDSSKNHFSSFISSFFLTLANPLTVVPSAAIFAGSGITRHMNHFMAGTMLTGVFIGSTAWWFTLTLGVSILKPRLMLIAERFINRVMGGIIFIIGVVTICGIIYKG